jgi:hypothetical protein
MMILLEGGGLGSRRLSPPVLLSRGSLRTKTDVREGYRQLPHGSRDARHGLSADADRLERHRDVSS